MTPLPMGVVSSGAPAADSLTTSPRAVLIGPSIHRPPPRTLAHRRLRSVPAGPVQRPAGPGSAPPGDRGATYRPRRPGTPGCSRQSRNRPSASVGAHARRSQLPRRPHPHQRTANSSRDTAGRGSASSPTPCRNAGTPSWRSDAPGGQTPSGLHPPRYRSGIAPEPPVAWVWSRPICSWSTSSHPTKRRPSNAHSHARSS